MIGPTAPVQNPNIHRGFSLKRDHIQFLQRLQTDPSMNNIHSTTPHKPTLGDLSLTLHLKTGWTVIHSLEDQTQTLQLIKGTIDYKVHNNKACFLNNKRIPPTHVQKLLQQLPPVVNEFLQYRQKLFTTLRASEYYNGPCIGL